MTLAMYAGRWIARNERGDVVGVGDAPEMALQMARALRPKERFTVFWVASHAPHVPLPLWLVQRVFPLLPRDRVWLVGGVVRDLLLNRPHHDWDFVTLEDGCVLARDLAHQLGGAYIPLDEERGTGRVVVRLNGDSPITLDFNTLRGQTLQDDLSLRDFTINAMAMALDGTLFDLHGGSEDLHARRVRRVSERSFVDDPLRMLRAVRLAVELQFQVDEGTAAQMRALASQIALPAAERVRDELLRILRARPFTRGLELLSAYGLTEYLLPEVTALERVQQTAPHYQASAWRHTLMAITFWETLSAWLEGQAHIMSPDVPESAWEALWRTLAPYQAPLLDYLRAPMGGDLTRADMLVWGTLFHDVGKAATRTLDAAGRAHFYGHAEQGAELTRLRLEALRFPSDAVDFAAALVAYHMRLIEMDRNAPPSSRAVYRFFQSTGEAGIGVLLLSLVDSLAVYGPQLSRNDWKARLEVTRALCDAYFERRKQIVAPVPLLNGHDLMALGIPAGPRMGELLAALREAQAAGDITTREEAEAYVRKLVAA